MCYKAFYFSWATKVLVTNDFKPPPCHQYLTKYLPFFGSYYSNLRMDKGTKNTWTRKCIILYVWNNLYVNSHTNENIIKKASYFLFILYVMNQSKCHNIIKFNKNEKHCK